MHCLDFLSTRNFMTFRECILKTAKALVEDTKLLVSGAGASQEKLAQAAQSSVSTITKLAEVVKLGAASLGSEDPETQVWTAEWPVSVAAACEGIRVRHCALLSAGGVDQCSEGCS